MQILEEAERERMLDVEVRRSLVRVPMPSSCQPPVRVLPRNRRNATRSVCRSWKRLNVSACWMSKFDGPLSARVSNGFWDAVWFTAPENPETNPPKSALVSSLAFESLQLA